jgi:hypothetical protein
MEISIETRYAGTVRAWWEPRESRYIRLESHIKAPHILSAAMMLLTKVVRFDRRWKAEVLSYRIRLGKTTIREYTVAELEKLG